MNLMPTHYLTGALNTQPRHHAIGCPPALDVGEVETAIPSTSTRAAWPACSDRPMSLEDSVSPQFTARCDV
jgi:hypothetical protein